MIFCIRAVLGSNQTCPIARAPNKSIRNQIREADADGNLGRSRHGAIPDEA